MKIIFIFLLLLHGLLHLLGFFKALDLYEIRSNLQISRSLGALWLLCFLLFLYVAWLHFFNKSSWGFFALAAVLISQSLIFLSWDATKFGSIVNLLILLISIPALGNLYFEKKVEKEVKALVERAEMPRTETISEKDISSLPPVVKNWLEFSGVIGKPPITFARLQQIGRMKTKPDGKWMPFGAEQFIDVANPAFVWKTRVKAAPFFYLQGRDKLVDGKGVMQIKVLSLINVVNEGPGKKINESAMQRFLAEICWFPAAALSSYIHWEQIAHNTAKAGMEVQGESVSGIFQFSDAGEMLSFETERYYGGGEEAKKERWLIETLETKDLSGYKIPSKSKVTWKLPEGNFTWLELEITKIDYNHTSN